MLLALGPRHHDATYRAVIAAALVVPDREGSAGADLDRLVDAAVGLAEAGADVIELRMPPGGDLDGATEAALLAPAIDAVVARVDRPLGLATRHRAVVEAGLEAGAVVVPDAADPDVLERCADTGATVIVSSELGPTSAAELVDRAQRAGIEPERIVVDVGPRCSGSFDGLGAASRLATQLSASGARVLVSLLGLQPAAIVQPAEAEADVACGSLVAAVALAAMSGAHVVRIDGSGVGGPSRIRSARRAVDTVAEIGRARERERRVTVHLVKGSDEILVSDALSTLVARLVGDGDRTLLVDEVVFDEKSEQIGPLIDAASTPPFLTDRRIVVGRAVQHFSRKDDVAPLVSYLESPLETTTLVLEWVGGRIPKSLTEAVRSAGGTETDTSPGRKTADWVDAQLEGSSLSFSAPARKRAVEWLGENVNRLPALLATLETALGPGAPVGPDDLERFLGVEEGGVPPWDLTDAIDQGDIPGSLDALHRMLGGGGRHPLQIMATLHGHVARILALDGADVRTDADAARLGMGRSTFPAKKARNQARKLGHDKVVEAIGLLAEADLDLRGQRDLPNEATLEVLVARLARLAR